MSLLSSQNSSQNLNPIAVALKAPAAPLSDTTVEQKLAVEMEVPGKRLVMLEKFEQPLDPKKIQRIRVKITFKDGQQPLIPAEFEYRSQRDDHIIQLWHQQEAVLMGRPELATVGRHREGMVDTGEPVFESNYPFQMSMLVRGFAANSFHLSNVFVQIKKKDDPHRKFPGGRPMPRRFHVLNLEFKFQEDVRGFEPKTVAGRRALMKMTFSYCKIWVNPDGMMTVNVGGLVDERAQKQPQKPRYALVVRKCNLATKMDPSGGEDEAE